MSLPRLCRRTGACAALFACAAMLVLAGCATPHAVSLTEAGAPRYERIAIDYRLDGDQGGLIAHLPASIQAVSAADEPDPPNGQRFESARLQIAYPHPRLGAAYAQVTLRLSQKSLTSGVAAVDEAPAGVVHIGDLGAAAGVARSTTSRRTRHSEEVRVLDLPKTELDLMLVDLAQSGFFDEQTRPNGTARLEISIDEAGTAKTWTTEPRLDDLASRAWRDGRQPGFMRLPGHAVADAGWSI